jgi:hypothetical protein
LKEHDHILTVSEDLAPLFAVAPTHNETELLTALSAAINHLANSDFNKLIEILYRLDISETRINQTLQENTVIQAGDLIAALVVERQLQKVKTRAQFTRQQDIPDDDKW